MGKKIKRTTKDKFTGSYKPDDDGAVEYLQSILHIEQLGNLDLDTEVEGDYFLGCIKEGWTNSNNDSRIWVEWVDCEKMKIKRIFTDADEYYGSSWVDGNLELYPRGSLILFKIYRFDFSRDKYFIIIDKNSIKILNRSLESLRAEKKQIDEKMSIEEEIIVKRSELEFYKSLGLKINLKQDEESHDEPWNGTLKTLAGYIVTYAKTRNNLYYNSF